MMTNLIVRTIILHLTHRILQITRVLFRAKSRSRRLGVPLRETRSVNAKAKMQASVNTVLV